MITFSLSLLDSFRSVAPESPARLKHAAGKFLQTSAAALTCIAGIQFASVADAQAKIEAWRVDYNQRRPHGSLGHLTQTEFVEQRQAIRVAEEVMSATIRIALAARKMPLRGSEA